MNISVIGLGKLGLCTAGCFASGGHKVIGVERNADFVSKLQKRVNPIDETGLDDLLESSWDNLTVTTDIAEAINGSDMTLIIVPTPSKEDGRFTNEYLRVVLEAIGPVLKNKSSFHVVDIVSTVMPGSCEGEFKSLLEKLSGKVCGEDFGLVYNPEFIALGSVVHDFLNPDMVLIGASDDRSADIAEQLYVSTCKSEPYIAKMSLVNAEITKLSLNCFVTMKISYANELTGICELVDGADVDEITKAIGADSRVGSKYLKGGLGFGGPCFPRDNLAFQGFAEDFGGEVKLSPQVVEVNKSVVSRIVNKIKLIKTKGCKVAVLGLSYKPGTHIIEESQSIMLVEELITAGFEVSVYDPKAMESSRAVLGDKVKYADDAMGCVKGSDVVVLMTNWPEFAALDHNELKGQMNKDGLFIDCWRTFKGHDFGQIEYKALGLGV